MSAPRQSDDVVTPAEQQQRVDVVAAVTALQDERDELLELLEHVVHGVVASSPVDGLTTARIEGFVMAEIRRRVDLAH